jgi:hypothetical protein
MPENQNLLPEMQETSTEIATETAMNEEIHEKTEDQPFDYKKEREERIKHKVEKSFLSDLGVNSFDEVKKAFNSLDSYKKQVDELKNEVSKSKESERKLEVLKQGFDEKFVDYIVHELNNKSTENEDFSVLLQKFKDENSQFLKNNTSIKFNTSPNFETSGKLKDSHQRMNDFFSGRSQII